MQKRDFITSMGGMSAAFLASSIPSETYASERESSDSKSFFNVRDFGAKGDGKTGDSEAIQRALDAAAKIDGTVWFPSGKYLCHDLKVSPHTTLLAEPKWIFRTDMHGACLVLDSEEADCMLDIAHAYGAHIKGLMICGIRKAAKKIHGIWLRNEKFSKREDTVVVEDTKVQGFSGHGLYLKRAWLFIIRHSQFMGNGGCGALLHGWDGFVIDNQFSGNGSHGFGTEEVGATVMFTSNRVEWNRGYGLDLVGGDDWNVVGNSFDRNFGAGINTEKMTMVSISANTFRRCGKDSKMLAEGETSAQAIFKKSSGLSVVGNSFKAGRDDGGKGAYTPQVGMILEKLRCCVISSNVLCGGYMRDMLLDIGGHSKDFVFKDNVGSPMWTGKQKKG